MRLLALVAIVLGAGSGLVSCGALPPAMPQLSVIDTQPRSPEVTKALETAGLGDYVLVARFEKNGELSWLAVPPDTNLDKPGRVVAIGKMVVLDLKTRRVNVYDAK